MLRLLGVRRGLLLSDGEVLFQGVSGWRIEEDRPGEAEAAARPGAAVVAQHRNGNEIALELNRQAGPGEEYRATLRFTAGQVTARLRPNLDRTLRHTAGFYPRARDLGRT